jgi:transcriptional regulator with XRE-family HTH domain
MDNPQDALRQRIKILVDELEGGVQRRFAMAVGAHATTIGEILGKRQNQPSSELLQRIAIAYPQLRTDWLLLGEGPMLRNQPTEDITPKNSAVSAPAPTVDEPQERYERGQPVTHGGITVPTGRRIKGQLAQEPLGSDLVRQIDTNTRNIELLQQQMETVVAELRELSSSREQ